MALALMTTHVQQEAIKANQVAKDVASSAQHALMQTLALPALLDTLTQELIACQLQLIYNLSPSKPSRC
jgi:hypothetical protein